MGAWCSSYRRTRSCSAPWTTACGHFRRYSRGELASLLAAAGFSVERLFPFNLWGLFGWWLNGSLLRRKRLPGGQLSVFSRLSGLLIWLERRLRLPLGLSYIAIARPAAVQQRGALQDREMTCMRRPAGRT